MNFLAIDPRSSDALTVGRAGVRSCDRTRSKLAGDWRFFFGRPAGVDEVAAGVALPGARGVEAGLRSWSRWPGPVPLLSANYFFTALAKVRRFSGRSRGLRG